jgi:hypothetical protein
VGEAVNDIIEDAGLKGDPEGIVYTNTRKTDLVDEAVVDWEAGNLCWPEDPNEVIQIAQDEHDIFTLVTTKKRTITYGAPDGFHDDTVNSVMLANRARRYIMRGRRVIPMIQ